MNIPLELIEQLRKGNVVLFCGAGISISEDGIPSGAQLAHELAQRAGLGDVGSMSLPEVAQAYELERGPQSLIAYITERVDDPRHSPLRTHHLIAALPFKRIITTNWDNLLEEALRQARKPFVQVVRDESVSYADDDKVLLIKLHGSAEQKDTIVITGDDYYDVFARLPQVANLVQSFFATKRLLFLGYGLADEDFKRLYLEVVRHLGKHMRRAYAVQLNPTPLMVKYWEQKNVQVIAADAIGFLETLGKEWGTVTTQMGGWNGPELLRTEEGIQPGSALAPAARRLTEYWSKTLLEKLRDCHTKQEQSVGGVHFSQTSFPQFIYRDQSSPRSAWNEILATYLSESFFEGQTVQHSIINSLPVKGWAEALGYRLVEQFLGSARPVSAWFVALQPAQQFDLSALFGEVGLGQHDITEPCVCVVAVMGYCEIRKIIGLLRAAASDPQLGNKLNLLVIVHLTDESLRELLTFESEVKHHMVIKTYCVRNPIMRSSEQHPWAPFELTGTAFPVQELFESPESHLSYDKAERDARSQKGYSGSEPTLERMRWDVTLLAIENFVWSSLELVHVPKAERQRKLEDLSAAWVSRLSCSDTDIPERALETFYASRLFVPAPQGDVPIRAIAGAISAYFDGFFLAHTRQEELRTEVSRRLLESARSRRAMEELGARLDPEAVTNWLALIFSVRHKKGRFDDWVVDFAATQDLSIAFDLHALRASHPEGKTLVERILRFLDRHGSGLSSMFLRCKFDRDSSKDHNSNGQADYREARALLQQIPDPNLLAAVLASCAIPQNRAVSDPELWSATVPSELLARLRDLGKKLSKMAVQLSNGAAISLRVMLLSDLSETFPSIKRSHLPEELVVKVQWVTAYTLALACGGRLPDANELEEAYAALQIRTAAFDNSEFFRLDQALTRTEWVAPVHMSKADSLTKEYEPDSLLRGKEFERDASPSYERTISRIMVGRGFGRESTLRLDIDRGLGDVDTFRGASAVPNTTQFAAFHVVFDGSANSQGSTRVRSDGDSPQV